MIRRLALLLVGALTAIAALTGCSSAPVSYAPDAYGVQVGGVYDCYYVNNAAEVQTLMANGLCPAGSVAYRMPESFLNEYFSYYDSPAYYNTYVPVAYRTSYESTYHVYYVQHTTVINAASKSATWKGSNGKTVSGSKVNTAKMKFSTGSGSKSTVGGGSLRGGSTKASSGTGKTKTSGTVKTKTGSGGSLRGRK